MTAGELALLRDARCRVFSVSAFVEAGPANGEL